MVTHAVIQIPAVPTWLWGVFLCVLSNCLTALGLVTQKMAHLQNEKTGKKGFNHFRQPWWIAGMCSFVLGQAANIPAMACAPQTMLSCLGGLSLVFNSTYAHFLLGERLKWTEVVVMFAMVVGAVLVVSVTPVSTAKKVYANQIFASILKPAFLITAVGVGMTLLALKILSKFRPQPLKIVFLGLTCAATGSYSMTFFKCGAEVVSSTSRWWLNLELYVLAVVALGIVFIQITSMNQGLRHGDVVIVIPTFFALGVLFSLVQAQLAFGELNDLKGMENIALFVSGVLLVIGSTIALLMLHSDDDEDEPLPTDSEQVPLLHRDHSSEPTLKRDHWSVTSLSPLGMPRGSVDNIHELSLISVTGPMGVA